MWPARLQLCVAPSRQAIKQDVFMNKPLASLWVWVAAVSACASCTAWAQATVKDDGQWRAALGVGASTASGNTKASSISINTDAVRATKQDKWGFAASSLYAKSGGVITADQMRGGTRYDYNVTEDWFGFGSFELERDKVAALKLRSNVGAGLGFHVIKNDSTTFDLFAGAGYTSDNYNVPRLVGGANRTDYAYSNLLLAQESTHKFSESTAAKQKLVVYPNLEDRGEYRAQFDAGLSVAMTKTMNVNVGFSARVNSDPGPNAKKTDTLLTTGISVKFE
jgi:putative salt-induced outer membrane protein YdiY